MVSLCQEATMVKKIKGVLVDESESLELNPEVWQELPEEILERVITKLPFSRVVAFRTVCKLWHSDIIPRAAPHLEASNGSTLLYFDFPKHYGETKQQWMKICEGPKSEWTISMQEFQPKLFPSPSNGERVRLRICEQGLLFFVVESKKNMMLNDIVVCNPLTSQTRSLGLPHPLQPPCMHEPVVLEVLLGTVFDTKTGGYSLVAAGVVETGNYATFVYDSLTSAWRNGSSPLPALLEVDEGLKRMCMENTRSVCSNGNLYWYAEDRHDGRQHVLKFDIQQDTWRLIPDIDVECDPVMCLTQMALFQGKITLWHLHSREEAALLEQMDLEWPCRCDVNLEFASEINLMEPSMRERVCGYLCVPDDPDADLIDYFAFSQCNFVYHIRSVWGEDGFTDSLKIIVQDTNEDPNSEWPLVQMEGFPGRYSSPSNVWSFSASLTSLP